MKRPIDNTIVREAVALRASHPHAPALDILDLVMRGRGDLWLGDLFEHMVPPSPFALLVAEAMGDASPAAEWQALTGPHAAPEVRDFMRQSYAESVLPRFSKRYGFCWPFKDRVTMTAVSKRSVATW